MGFFDRLRGRRDATTHTTIERHFEIKVPLANADDTRAAIGRWIQSKGWASVVRSQREGDFVVLTVEHDEAMEGPPPALDNVEMTAELQRVIEAAFNKPA